jgi:sporulation protein YlmC with PRC-barrel domain
MKIPIGGAVVVPHDSTVISSDDVNVDVPWDEVQAVMGAEIIAGHHNVNARTL